MFDLTFTGLTALPLKGTCFAALPPGEKRLLREVSNYTGEPHILVCFPVTSNAAPDATG